MEDHDISPSLMARAQFEDSRRRWRRNAFWRGVLVTFGVLIALGAVGAWLGAGRHFSPHIAHVSIHGTIFDEPARTALLRDLRDAETAKAVLLDIDSPGGTTVGAETIYLLMREIAETRPVVAVLGEVAASGGYVAALSADHVVARGNTLTGSIGVIMEYPNMTSLLERVG
ncbi:MAG: S49 family peptidase, partial [Pseudomonadota bacterium]